MENRVILRKAVPMDAEKILEYCKLVGSETDFLSYGAEGLPYNIVQEKLFISNYNASSNAYMVVAILDNDVIGIANFLRHSNPRKSHRGKVGISLLKKFWGKNIAGMLLRQIIEFAKSINAETITSEVMSKNERALNFYKKFGFKKITTLPKYVKVNGEYMDTDIIALDL